MKNPALSTLLLVLLCSAAASAQSIRLGIRTGSELWLGDQNFYTGAYMNNRVDWVQELLVQKPLGRRFAGEAALSHRSYTDEMPAGSESDYIRTKARFGGLSMSVDYRLRRKEVATGLFAGLTCMMQYGTVTGVEKSTFPKTGNVTYRPFSFDETIWLAGPRLAITQRIGDRISLLGKAGYMIDISSVVNRYCDGGSGQCSGSRKFITMTVGAAYAL